MPLGTLPSLPCFLYATPMLFISTSGYPLEDTTVGSLEKWVF